MHSVAVCLSIRLSVISHVLRVMHVGAAAAQIQANYAMQGRKRPDDFRRGRCSITLYAFCEGSRMLATVAGAAAG